MNEIDYRRFIQIMTAIVAGRKVSKADRDYFTSAYAEADPAVYETLKGKVDRGETLTDADHELMFSEARKMFLAPENKAKVIEMSEKMEQGKIAQNVKTGLSLLLGTADVVTSLRQIRESEKLTKSTRRPSRPAALERDTRLAAALDQASRPSDAVERTLLPAREGNREQYQNDLATARTASAGQASDYGAYAQGASLRRSRADLNLVPLGDSVRRQELGRRDQLLGMSLGENQAIDQSRSRFYPEELYQYNLDRNIASNLGQVGRLNLRSSMTGIGNQLPGAVSRYATQGRYSDWYNKALASGLDPQNAHISSSARLRAEQDYIGDYNYPNFDHFKDYEQAAYS